MARRNFNVDINLNQNELQNAVTQNLGSAPSNPKEGQRYYNTVDHKEYFWNGTSWVAGGKEYTFSTGLTEASGTVTLNQATSSALGGVIAGTNINISNGTISVNDATNAQKGVIQIANDSEAATGTDEGKAINSKQLKTGLDSKIDKNQVISGATHTKITYDSKGLVTSGSDLQASDIPNLSLSKITDVTASANEVNILNGATVSTTELNYVSGVTSAIQDQLNSKLNIADIIDNVNTTTTNQALSANMGKELSDRIQNIANIGKYLSNWNSTTGLPTTTPQVIPYTYTSGMYYVVSVVASEGGTNYRPDGTQYTGAASTTVETDTVEVGDFYLFDGTTWSLLKNTGVSTVFSKIGGSPYDNSNLASALNSKVTANNNITGDTKCKITYDSKGLVTGGADLTTSDIPDLSGTYLTLDGTQTVTNKTIDADDNSITDLTVTNFKSGVVQTSIRGASSATDDALATEKAIRTAIDTIVGGAVSKISVTNPALTQAGGVCTWTVTHSLGADVICAVKEISTGEEVYCEIVYGGSGTTIKMNSSTNIAADTYKAIIIG